MNSKPLYFDDMASTPLDPRVFKAMRPFLEDPRHMGNADANHSYGHQAKDAINQAKEKIAASIGGQAQGLTFTSGATESINLALRGAAHFYGRQGKHLITTMSEHQAVLKTCEALSGEGYDVTLLSPNPCGLITLEALKEAIRPETLLISLTAVNGEIGTIQPLHDIIDLCRSKGILLHVDAAQAVGRIPLDVSKIDFCSLSAHKCYGPKGIGALHVRQNPSHHLEPILYGGKGSHPLRPGTLATPQIIGMAEAFHLAHLERESDWAHAERIQQYFKTALAKMDAITLNVDHQDMIPHLINIRSQQHHSETLLSLLSPDLACSTGSACHSGHNQPSHVLKAIGLTHLQAQHALRISYGRFTTMEMAQHALQSIEKAMQIA